MTSYNIWIRMPNTKNEYDFGGIVNASSPKAAIRKFHNKNFSTTKKYMATPTTNTHYETMLE